MKKTALAMVVLGLAGCSSDSAHTLSRDYRNLNNECIDAMMMITSERAATFARDKIYKPYSDRLGIIDHRCDVLAAKYRGHSDHHGNAGVRQRPHALGREHH